MHGLDENTHLQESPNLLSQDDGGSKECENWRTRETDVWKVAHVNEKGCE